MNHLGWVCNYFDAAEIFVVTFATLHVQSGSSYNVHRVVCSIPNRGAAVSFRQVRPPGLDLFQHLTFWHGPFIIETFLCVHVLALRTYWHMDILSPWTFQRKDFLALGHFGIGKTVVLPVLSTTAPLPSASNSTHALLSNFIDFI